MWKLDDFKITLSSIEFSFFYQQPTCFCPSCGHSFPSDSLYNVPFHVLKYPLRFSSLLIAVGIGSYIGYTFFNGRKKNDLSANDIAYSFDQQLLKDEEDKSCYTPFNYIKKCYKYCASTPHPFILDRFNLANSQQLELYSSLDQYLSRSFSSASQSSFYDGTVAKLDQLLNQIDDIKQTVAEIDADFLNVGNKSFSTLEYTNSLKDHEEEEKTKEKKVETSSKTSNETSNGSKEVLTTSLEWDVNDIYLLNEKINNSLLARLENSTNSLKIQDFNPNLTEFNHSLFSRDSSGNGSSLNSSESFKNKTIFDLLEEAKKKGVLNDLITYLLENIKKKPTAYLEN